MSSCKDLNKVKPPEVPERMGKDGGRALKASLLSRELLTAGSCWEKGESFSFVGVATGKLPMLRCMDLNPSTYGQQSLD